MSPDQTRGESPDARSDIYSLGVMLFEMLSGRLPFQADSAITLMMMHHNDPVPDLHALRQDTPEDLAAIVQKSLSKTRPERYTTAGEMSAALSAVYNRLTRDDLKITSQVEAPPPAPGFEKPSDGSSQPTFALPPQKVVTITVALPASAPSSQIPPAAAPPAQKSRFPVWIGVAAVVLIVLVIAGGFGLSGMLAARPTGVALPAAQDTAPTQAANAPQATNPPQAVVAAAPSPTATLAPLPSGTPAPAETALPAASTPAGATTAAISGAPAVAATPAIPADIPYAQISKIDVDSQDHYVVSFEVLNADKLSSGDRMAFYFNDAPRTAGGFPKQGFYIVYTAGSPFTILKTAARSKAASQMCALIGKSDNTLLAGSGNCVPLPDVASVTAGSTTPCLLGPGGQYPVAAQLAAGATVLVYGFSADQSWWYVQNPSDLKGTCWVAKETTTANGDSSSLKQVEPPPTPTAGY